jgi:SanA protein
MGNMKRLPSATNAGTDKRRSRRLGWLVLVPIVCLGLVVLVRWWTNHRYGSLIYTVDTAPPRRVAIVFGAAVLADGRPSAVLADRVHTATALYHAGRVEKLLMTGDHSRVDYNEPQAMSDYAQELGVPAEEIVLDYAGRRTYDSCYRARHIFGVTDAILVTQSYHLDRALFTAHALGIDAVGVGADLRDYTLIRQWWWRELLATPVAWLDVHGILRPQPILGEEMPIFAD